MDSEMARVKLYRAEDENIDGLLNVSCVMHCLPPNFLLIRHNMHRSRMSANLQLLNSVLLLNEALLMKNSYTTPY